MEEITLCGIIITFIIGVVNVFVTLKFNNKTAYINAVTLVRKEYIQNLRDLVAEFVYIATRKEVDTDKLDKLACQLQLMMNPANNHEKGWWDRQAIDIIDKILKKEKAEENIRKFVILV